jgi:hypothetical protein
LLLFLESLPEPVICYSTYHNCLECSGNYTVSKQVRGSTDCQHILLALGKWGLTIKWAQSLKCSVLEVEHHVFPSQTCSSSRVPFTFNSITLNSSDSTRNLSHFWLLPLFISHMLSLIDLLLILSLPLSFYLPWFTVPYSGSPSPHLLNVAIVLCILRLSSCWSKKIILHSSLSISEFLKYSRLSMI